MAHELEKLTFFASLSALIFNLLQLKYDGTKQNMFQDHPMMAGVVVISLIMCCFLLWIKLKYPKFYDNKYLRSLPFVVSFFASLFIASTISLLLQGYVTPLMFIVFLVLPVAKASYWVFLKLDEHFGETEFWIRVAKALYWVLMKLDEHFGETMFWMSLDPKLCNLRRRIDRVIRRSNRSSV